MEESRGPMTKGQLERICYRCHQVNKRGSLCLLLLRDGSNCARRAFLQRHHRAGLRPRVVPQAGVGTNPLPRLPRLPQPTCPPGVEYSGPTGDVWQFPEPLAWAIRTTGEQTGRERSRLGRKPGERTRLRTSRENEIPD